MRRTALALLLLASLVACSTRDPFANPFEDPKPGWATVPDHDFAPRGLAMFDGKRGTVLTWFDLSQAVAWADVIIIGEQHDDAVAHAVQTAIVQETLVRFPRTALSMEMLERDDQPAVDAFLRGEIDADTFIDRTNSRNWSGKDSWVVFYQPMIDAARLRGAPVIAANAPRPLVRKARLEGYDALRALPAEERALVDLPKRPSKPAYRDRFGAVMNGMNPDEPSDPTAIDATFRSQSVWDATMAASIIEARRRAAALPGRPFSSPKVIHVVGQFHCDFEGGLVQEIDARNGLLKICVISIQRRDGETLAEDDRGRAAIVVYSGARPAKEADPVPDPVGAPTTTPPTPPASPPEGTVPMTIPWPTTPPGPRVNQ